MKVCRRCMRFLTFDEFYRNGSKRDGLSAYCKPCWNDYMKPRNAERMQRTKPWQTEERRAYLAAWREANRERYNAAKRDRYLRTIDRSRERGRRNRMARRARANGACRVAYLTEDIFERDGWRCGLCGRVVNKRRFPSDPLGPSIDHIVPLALGGADAPDNVQLAHLSCNKRKGARIAA